MPIAPRVFRFILSATVLAAGVPFAVSAQETGFVNVDRSIRNELGGLQTVEPPDNMPPTLMFSRGELFSIEEVLSQNPLFNELAADQPAPVDPEAAPTEQRLRNNLYLSALVFAAPSDWTIWINSQPYRPGDQPDRFEVSLVTPDYIELSVPWTRNTRQTVRLAPNQTYVAGRGQVIEGRVR